MTFINPGVSDKNYPTGSFWFMVSSVNDLIQEQKKIAGRPREKYQNWIGSIIPDNIDAGYQIARQILHKSQNHTNGKIEMFAISGNRRLRLLLTGRKDCKRR